MSQMPAIVSIEYGSEEIENKKSTRNSMEKHVSKWPASTPLVQSVFYAEYEMSRNLLKSTIDWNSFSLAIELIMIRKQTDTSTFPRL